VTTYAYDPNGNLQSTVEPRGNVAGCNCANDYRTSYTYDAAGRLLTQTKPDPDGVGPQAAPVTTNTYDPVGNLASAKDANNHTTSYTYDAAGRILTVTAPDNGVTTYTYDPVGNLLTRRDDNNHATTFAYDEASRLSSETSPDPDGGGPLTPAVTSYTYDPNGNRLTLTDPNGNATPAPGDGQTTNSSRGFRSGSSAFIAQRGSECARSREEVASGRPEGRESSRVVQVMEEPRDAALFNGDEDGLVRVEAALSALRQEAVHDHGVPRTGRDVEAVLSQRTPGSGGQFVDLAAQGRDAVWAHVFSRKGGVEPYDPRRLRSDDLGEHFAIRSEERTVEVLDELPDPLLVHREHSSCRRRRVGLVLSQTSSQTTDRSRTRC
jgi:YD repeat-containing protein